MGMCDWYEPRGAFSCLVCGGGLREWQGTDGPCALFVFREGQAGAVDQRFDDEVGMPKDELRSVELPADFQICSYDCGCPYPTTLKCACVEGKWSSTSMFTGTPEDREQGVAPKAEWKRRLAWLDGRKGSL